MTNSSWEISHDEFIGLRNHHGGLASRIQRATNSSCEISQDELVAQDQVNGARRDTRIGPQMPPTPAHRIPFSTTRTLKLKQLLGKNEIFGKQIIL